MSYDENERARLLLEEKRFGVLLDARFIFCLLHFSWGVKLININRVIKFTIKLNIGMLSFNSVSFYTDSLFFHLLVNNMSNEIIYEIIE